MYSIRAYKLTDYEMVCNWWNAANEPAPTEEMLPLETTFILEMQEQPALCLSVFLTNCRALAFFENFVGNPELKGPKRHAAAQALIDAAIGFAKSLGYSRVMGISTTDKLTPRYEQLGFTVQPNVHCVVREV